MSHKCYVIIISYKLKVKKLEANWFNMIRLVDKLTDK